MSTHSFPGDNYLIGQGEKEVILQMLSCFLLKLLTHPLPYDVSIYKIEETLIWPLNNPELKENLFPAMAQHCSSGCICTGVKQSTYKKSKHQHFRNQWTKMDQNEWI